MKFGRIVRSPERVLNSQRVLKKALKSLKQSESLK